ncbi:MAG: capsular biosynthesis protein [Peptococcaceae bacterium BRH_c4b]|nr:MAG: capsular biosynthesis protein [Peptococcaceae bacterium BRH_c4b]
MNQDNIRVAVFGLGFVGLPLALSFALRGCKVYGVDVNEELVEEINSGVTYHHESYRGEGIREILRRELDAGRFRATTRPQEAMASCDNIIITVGLPVSDGVPYTGHLEECVRSVAASLKKGDLVVVRGTLVPGMTRGLVLPLLETSGLKAGEDFNLAYSSERIAEGKAFEEFENMPGLVSGYDRGAALRSRELLSVVTKAELTVASSFEVVETAKVVENVSRDVNIAFVNELARFTKAMDIDIFEVIALANTHKRVNLLTPGPGVGGYCIPNALHYLTPRAGELGVELALMGTARQVNENMPAHVVSLVMKNLKVPPAAARVAVLGIAMKDYSSDARCSPAHRIINLLERAGVEVRAYDPAVPSMYHFTVDSLEDALGGAHGAVLLARQDGMEFTDLEFFVRLMNSVEPFVIDAKNMLGGVESPPGLTVEGL